MLFRRRIDKLIEKKNWLSKNRIWKLWKILSFKFCILIEYASNDEKLSWYELKMIMLMFLLLKLIQSLLLTNIIIC